MLRRFLTFFLVLTLCLTTTACGSNTDAKSANTFNNNTGLTANRLPDGTYPVQQATYNDANGEYTIMVLNTPAGASPTLRTADLQMARLTDEEINSGKKTYLAIKDNQPIMHLTEDFKIEYVHNVTETETDPQTGQPQTVIVRQQSSFWTPFAGALAGQALGSLLFRPQYYVPPVYQPGGVLTGYGGYGTTYNQAVNSYQTRYNSPPPAVSNRQAFRSSGSLRNSSTSTSSTAKPSSSSTTNKSTGSGYGTNTLKSSDKSTSSSYKRTPSFGSSSNRRSTRSFGSRRR